jgi:hypothetical protein
MIGHDDNAVSQGGETLSLDASPASSDFVSDHPVISRALEEILSEMTGESGFSSFTSHSSAVQD